MALLVGDEAIGGPESDDVDDGAGDEPAALARAPGFSGRAGFADSAADAPTEVAELDPEPVADFAFVDDEPQAAADDAASLTDAATAQTSEVESDDTAGEVAEPVEDDQVSVLDAEGRASVLPPVDGDASAAAVAEPLLDDELPAIDAKLDAEETASADEGASSPEGSEQPFDALLKEAAAEEAHDAAFEAADKAISRPDDESEPGLAAEHPGVEGQLDALFDRGSDELAEALDGSSEDLSVPDEPVTGRIEVLRHSDWAAAVSSEEVPLAPDDAAQLLGDDSGPASVPAMPVAFGTGSELPALSLQGRVGIANVPDPAETGDVAESEARALEGGAALADSESGDEEISLVQARGREEVPRPRETSDILIRARRIAQKLREARLKAMSMADEPLPVAFGREASVVDEPLDPLTFRENVEEAQIVPADRPTMPAASGEPLPPGVARVVRVRGGSAERQTTDLIGNWKNQEGDTIDLLASVTELDQGTPAGPVEVPTVEAPPPPPPESSERVEAMAAKKRIPTAPAVVVTGAHDAVEPVADPGPKRNFAKIGLDQRNLAAAKVDRIKTGATRLEPPPRTHSRRKLDFDALPEPIPLTTPIPLEIPEPVPATSDEQRAAAAGLSSPVGLAATSVRTVTDDASHGLVFGDRTHPGYSRNASREVIPPEVSSLPLPALEIAPPTNSFPRVAFGLLLVAGLAGAFVLYKYNGQLPEFGAGLGKAKPAVRAPVKPKKVEDKKAPAPAPTSGRIIRDKEPEPARRVAPTAPAKRTAEERLDLFGGGAAAKTKSRRMIIEVQPAGQVFIDGVDRGRPPVTVENLAPGNHALRVTRPGKAPFEQTIYVVGEPQERLNIQLPTE